MNQIEQLIAAMCPRGVPYKAVGDFAELVRGSGMPKADFVESGVGCIHYGQIYTSYGTWATKTLSFVSSEKAARLAKVVPGDVIITNTSENVEDVCKAVAWLGDSQIVTGGHATVLKHREDPKYIAYFFQTPRFSAEKKKLATGTKVIDVSARSLAKIRIPLPPITVQRAIVKILDRFAELEAKLEAELEAELEARQTQYSYYRNALLTFGEQSVASSKQAFRWATLSEIGSLYGGLTGKSKEDFGSGNALYVSYMNVLNNIRTNTSPDDSVTVKEGERQNRVRRGDVLFTSSSETPDEVGMSSVTTAEPKAPLYLNSFCFGFRLNDSNLLFPDFAKHLFRAKVMRAQIVQTANGVTRFNVSKERFRKLRVPIPPREEQQRIAAILDKFAALVNDLSSGLPAELKARRQQYRYYRDRLLTFREAA